MTQEQSAALRARAADLNAQICAAARERRLEMGVLQAQLAAHLGMAESTFSRYESGQRTMSAALLCMIAAALRQPLSSFLPPGLALPAAGDPQALSPAVQQVSAQLQAHPELLPSVLGLIETLLEQSPTHAAHDA
jgi:transcriptional regulator with XRE-family HTH domain